MHWRSRKKEDSTSWNWELTSISYGTIHVENEKLAQILAARQLETKQIPSDDRYIERAIEDQLKELECPLTIAALRNHTAKYMQSHEEDFLPFLTNPNYRRYVWSKRVWKVLW